MEIIKNIRPGIRVANKEKGTTKLKSKDVGIPTNGSFNGQSQSFD